MKAVIVASGAGHQESWGGAFAKGLRRHGWATEISTRHSACDMLVLWGVRNKTAIAEQKSRGGEICILERGYLGDRFAWTSVSFGGGLNGRGVFRGPFSDGSRWEKNFAPLMQPWRQRNGGYALIMGQVPNDMSLHGLMPQRLWEDAAIALSDMGLDVHFRGHPLAERMKIPGTTPAKGDLEAALHGASLVLTINSNSGVDAVLAGVPTIALDNRSMAWPVTAHDIVVPPTPDRTEWAHAMAWKQFTLEEMASGACWDAVGSVR